MNVIRRYASSSTSAVPEAGFVVPVSTPYLPPVLEKHVQLHLLAHPASTRIPNPFTSVPREISRRREKKIRQSLFTYEGLPPSEMQPAPSSVRIAWPDGEMKDIAWEDVKQQGKTISTESRWTTGIHAGKKEIKYKGHKHEREKPERERETRERLAGMDKRIAEWKKVNPPT